MADLEKTVAIIFEGVDAMGSGIDSATKKVDGVADAVSRASQPMTDFTLGIAKFEAALIAGGAAATAFAVKLAADFDAGFREITTLIEEPAEVLDQFRGDILDYASGSTQSIDQVNSALYSLISAGADTETSLDMLAQAEKLAVGGKTDLATAAGVLSGSLNAYGDAAGSAEDVTDALFVGVKNGITTVGELSSALPQITSLAGQLGVSFDEVVSAVSALTSTGLPTSQAVTQIAAALNSVLGPSEKAKATAKDLSIEFDAAALRSEGLAGFLDTLGEATGGSEEQMNALFGSAEATRGVLSLLGPVADKFSVNLEDMESKAGATAAAYEKMADDIGLGTQRIQNAMTGAFIAVGDPLLNEFGGIQNAIAEIFNAIGASVDDGQLKGFVDELEGMFGSIQRALEDVAKNLPTALEQADFSSFFDGIEAVQSAVSQLFDGADLSSADGLVSVIETLGLGFEFLSEYTAGAITAIGPFLEQLGELARLVLEIDPDLVKWVGTVGGAAVVVSTLATAVKGLTGFLRAFAGKGGVVATSSGALKTLVGVMTGPLGLAAATGIVAKGVYDAGETFFGMEGRVAEATKEVNAQIEAIDRGELVWDHATGQWAKAGEAQEDLATRTARMNQELQDAFNGVSRGSDELSDHAKAVDEVNGKYTDYEAMVESAWKQSQAFTGEQDKSAEALRGVFDEIGPLEQAWQKVGDGVYENVSNLAELETAYGDVKAAFDEGLITKDQFDEITKYYKSMKSGAEEGAKAQEALAGEVLSSEEAILKARDAVLEQELALEGLASNERIKNMEFTASIAVASLEADAQKVEAILDATSQTISDLGAATNDMFGTLAGDGLSRFQEMDLERAIDQQLKIQREAADQQKKLIDAQIDQMKAKTQALKEGDGLIKIDSTGLEPALEMIMWEIIEKVQMRANAEGVEFLLGI